MISNSRAAEGGSMIKRIIHKLKHRRFCKLNNYFCPDCIYHNFVWEGITFRGNRCRYPKGEKE